MIVIKEKILLVLENGTCVEGRIVESSDNQIYRKMKHLETLEGIREVRPYKKMEDQINAKL